VALDWPRDLRIGVVASLFEQADPRVAALCEEALAELPGRLEQVSIPLHDEIATIAQLILLPEAATVHLPWMRTRLVDYGPDVRARLLAGLLLPSTAYPTGLRARRWAAEEYARELGAYDLVVHPAMGVIAPRIDAVPPDFRLLVIPYNSHWNLLGHPAASVPCGFVDGLPVGLCIAGRRLEDDLVLSAAHAFQQATDWHERTPVDGASGEVLYTGDIIRP
jgi:aspartyl-tRNA(Asn)/glutamyl-tRNA(Gln) amidotransferase subunit A